MALLEQRALQELMERQVQLVQLEIQESLVQQATQALQELMERQAQLVKLVQLG
jgi:hypothetical protein